MHQGWVHHHLTSLVSASTASGAIADAVVASEARTLELRAPFGPNMVANSPPPAVWTTIQSRQGVKWGTYARWGGDGCWARGDRGGGKGVVVEKEELVETGRWKGVVEKEGGGGDFTFPHSARGAARGAGTIGAGTIGAGTFCTSVAHVL
jgi:hypothetical protein